MANQPLHIEHTKWLSHDTIYNDVQRYSVFKSLVHIQTGEPKKRDSTFILEWYEEDSVETNLERLTKALGKVFSQVEDLTK